MTAGIEWRNIRFRYLQETERRQFDDFSLTIRPGRTSVLTGPSGCGKSTLLFLAAGLYPEHGGFLEAGSVWVSGRNLAGLDAQEKSRLVRVIFQNADLQFCLNRVDRELIFVMENAGIAPEEMPGRMRRVLKDVGLEGYEERQIASLSGGEKQRLGLASQLVAGAEWLLLDEVLAQVDPEQSRSLVRLIAELQKKQGFSVLAVDHHLEYWQDFADDFYLLSADGTLRAGPERCRCFSPADWAEAGVIAKGSRSFKAAASREAGSSGRTDASSQTASSLRPAARGTSAGETAAVLSGGRAASPELLLEADNLTICRGGECVLKQASFTLESGKIYALMGRSGAGKSSLLMALAGFLPYEGSLKGPCAPLKRKRFRRALRASSSRLLFQNPQDQFVEDTVRDELLFTLKRRFPGDEKKQRDEAVRLLKEHHLWPWRRYAPFQLSEGQQRRLAVLCLLAESGRLLLCDEPFYAQDLRNEAAIMQELEAAASGRGAAVLFTTHDPELAPAYADVLMKLEGGRLYAENLR